MPKLVSLVVHDAPSSGAQKLGQPVRFSNLVVEENSGGTPIPAKNKIAAMVIPPATAPANTTPIENGKRF